MSATMLHLVGQALLLGALHALIPCAHSWPMVVPMLRPRVSPLRTAIPFGLGKVVASIGLGVVIGGAFGTLPQGWKIRAEEVTGWILLLLGLLVILRPGVAHLGHLHGDCDRTQVLGDGCHHATHQPDRFARLGPLIGLFVLGVLNMVLPCTTNAAALVLAASAGSLPGAALVFGLYGLSAAIAMTILLLIVHRSASLLKSLGNKKVEMVLLRASGVLMVIFSLTLLLHWHEH